MKMKILPVIAATLFLIQWSCPSGPTPPNTINLGVPYHAQECLNWCGIACIQMWAAADSFPVTQAEIANYLGIQGDQMTSPFELERGVGHFTCSPGWLETRPWYEPSAKGDLIAASITGIKYGVPSIMPFYGGDHAVLIKGYRWQVVDEKPFAISCWYHDPAGKIDYEIPAARLNSYFDCGLSDYWVIVGWYDFVLEGIDGHAAFVAAGGTYYGGPETYDPFVAEE